jgi:hypothetical protein
MPDNAFTPVGKPEDTTSPETVPETAPVPEVRPMPEPEAAPVPDDPDAFTHYVHLADGRILKANLTAHTDTLGQRFYEKGADGAETSTGIIGVYAK